MSRWIPESVAASTRRSDRTDYLRALAPLVQERVETYFAASPDGEEVQLACLEAVGRTELEALRGARALGTAKRDLALLVTRTVVELRGAGHVQTLRRDDGRVSTTRNPRPDLGWVYSFTPLRVVAG